VLSLSFLIIIIIPALKEEPAEYLQAKQLNLLFY